MKCTAALFVCFLVTVAAAIADVHPVEKVINMLRELQGIVKGEGQAEEVQYGKYKYWCTTSTKTLQKAIDGENALIEQLEDRESSLVKEETALNKSISSLEARIGKLEAAGQAAETNRGQAATLFSEAESDYADTIKAVSDALEGLETSRDGVFAQVPVSPILPASPRLRRALALLGQSATEKQREVIAQVVTQPVLAWGDREKHVRDYEFKSHSVVELLKELLLKFQDERLDARKAETNAINAHALAKVGRDNEITAASADKGQKEGRLGDVKVDLGEVKEALLNTRADLVADKQLHEDTRKACMLKETQWEERSRIRKEELEAMDAAVEILSKATGVRTEAPSNPILPPAPHTEQSGLLLQVARDPKQAAVSLLRAAARQAHSRSLERIAAEISSHASGPFNEVIAMIEKMIFRLEKEQTDEDTHKQWCDLEIGKTEASASDKGDKIQELVAKISAAKAHVSLLKQEIKDASEMIASITRFEAEATEIRKVGKAENGAAIKDALHAQTSIANAIAVLETFYKDSGKVPKEAWEFVQQGHRDPVTLPSSPALWTAPYTGVADPTAQPEGIVAVLEKVAADFSQIEASSRANEAADQKEYEETMKSAAVEKARRSQEVDTKTSESKRTMDNIMSMTSYHKHVSGELEIVEKYMVDLQPACIIGDSTYEDRKAARAKELEALRQAQVLLQNYRTAEPAPATGAPETKFLQVRRHTRLSLSV